MTRVGSQRHSKNKKVVVVGGGISGTFHYIVLNNISCYYLESGCPLFLNIYVTWMFLVLHPHMPVIRKCCDVICILILSVHSLVWSDKPLGRLKVPFYAACFALEVGAI
jgi:hypothetical protein